MIGSIEARSSAANDNALVRIAHDMRRTAFAWRHGAAVDAFAAGRQEILASWDELRAQTRERGDAVALTPVYRETLDRHAALLREAEPFRARPEAFSASTRRAQHRPRGPRRVRAAPRPRAPPSPRGDHAAGASAEEARRTSGRTSRPETRQGELALEGGAVRSTPPEPPARFDAVPPPDEQDMAQARAMAEEDLAPQAPEPPKPDWRSTWDPVMGEWNALVDRARQSGAIAFYTEGYAGLIPGIRELTENPDVPADRRESLAPLLESHERHRRGAQAGRAVPRYRPPAQETGGPLSKRRRTRPAWRSRKPRNTASGESRQTN